MGRAGPGIGDMRGTWKKMAHRVQRVKKRFLNKLSVSELGSGMVNFAHKKYQPPDRFVPTIGYIWECELVNQFAIPNMTKVIGVVGCVDDS